MKTALSIVGVMCILIAIIVSGTATTVSGYVFAAGGALIGGSALRASWSSKETVKRGR